MNRQHKIWREMPAIVRSERERKFTLISFFSVSLLFGLDEVDQAERAGSLAVAIWGQG